MSDDLVKSRLGYTYDLKDALRHNSTIIQAGDDICAVALGRIEALEAENARLREALQDFARGKHVMRQTPHEACQWVINRSRAVLQEKDKERTNDQEPV